MGDANYTLEVAINFPSAEDNGVEETEVVAWTMDELQHVMENMQSNTNVFFLITMGTIIFFMQCGFAFLEAGAVRSKNTTNILIKNMLDVFIGGIAYWLVGFALAFGSGNGFCGATLWAAKDTSDERLAFWFFQFVFAATAATIVSGSMAERCAFHAYLIYSVLLTAVVYPVVSHWAWADDGWLVKTPYQDFAGSGVVHLTGGIAALIGAVILGPRHGRFEPNDNPIRGHSVPLAALGGFILLFGFLAFNGGSQASISQPGDAGAVAHAIVNTIIAGCFGGLTTLLIYRSGICEHRNTWSFLMALNGALTGMVAICAGCNVMPLWSSSVTGVVAGLLFIAVHSLLVKLKVDDPLDAVAVHMGGGLWGLVAVALFQHDGILFGGSGKVLAWNVAGALAIIGWVGGVCIILFGSLRLLGWLRVPLEMEIQGMDILKHGEPAYPAESWEELQYLHRMPSNNKDDDANSSIRNNYLPPNMSVPNRGGGGVWTPPYHHQQYPPSGPAPSYHHHYPPYHYQYPPPGMYWTLPGKQHSKYPYRHPSPPRHTQGKVSEFYPTEDTPHHAHSLPRPPPLPHEVDEGHEKVSKGHRSRGYSNEAFDEDAPKI